MLYFFVDSAAVFSESEKRRFMAELDWPLTLKVKDQTYILISRGFWSGAHYWCKVLKRWLGTNGVWLHENQQNIGNACLINKDPSSIAGPSLNTSWFFYSRAWTDDEDAFFLEKIQNIAKDHLEAKKQVMFAHL